ncbi:hypothetical protein AYX15_07177, partial [Cryptococcus neoformans]
DQVVFTLRGISPLGYLGIFIHNPSHSALRRSTAKVKDGEEDNLGVHLVQK